MDMTDNGPLNSKQIFVELRSSRFVKNRTVCQIWWFNRWFERFNAGLTTKWFIEMDQIEKFIG